MFSGYFEKKYFIGNCRRIAGKNSDQELEKKFPETQLCQITNTLHTLNLHYQTLPPSQRDYIFYNLYADYVSSDLTRQLIIIIFKAAYYYKK